MREPKPIKLDIHFPIDKPNANGYVFTEEAVKSALKEVKRLPIIKYGEPERIIGIVDKGELNGETTTASGRLFSGGVLEEIASGTQDLEYTYENGELNITSFGVIPKRQNSDCGFKIVNPKQEQSLEELARECKERGNRLEVMNGKAYEVTRKFIRNVD